jgi:hypothetical protein
MKTACRFSATHRVAVVLWALLVLAVVGSQAASASMGPQSAGPRVVSPVNDVTIPEAAVRFAWSAAPGTSRHYLLVSREPFDPRGWTTLPAGGAVEVREVARPIASLDEVGLHLDADARLYWAAADADPGTGRVAFSDVHTCFVLRKFSNRVEQSPLISVSPIGREEPAATPGAWRIRLRAGYDIDPTLGEPSVPMALRESVAPARGTRSYLVYYGDADPEQTRQSILASGGVVVAYIPDRTFLVRMASSSQFSLDGGWVGTYQPAYKLAPELSADPMAPQTATVLVFPDGDLDAVKAAAGAAGIQVALSSSNGINKVLRVTGTTAALTALAQHGDVAWVEPYVQPKMDNDQAQWVIQTAAANNRRVWDLGIMGEGQVVMTSDSGVEMLQNMFRDPIVPVTTFGSYPTHRKVIAYLQGLVDPLITFGDHGVFHGTHTAGTVCGNDTTLGTSAYDGMAKNAKLFFMDISGSTLGTSVAPPADLNDLFQPSYDGNAGGAARIASNSWGAANAGVYDAEAYQVDQFMWNHPDYLIFFSNGNSGPFVGTVGSPAVSKNCAGVGGTGDGTSLNAFFSQTSRGPTVDKRRKPTVAAPATLFSAFTAPNFYQQLSGTSMASPSAAGCAALIRQYLTEGWYPTGAKVPANGFSPSSALLKAMCINSGNNLYGTPVVRAPDNNIGWGRIDADSVLYFSGDQRRLLLVDNTAGLGHGQYIEYKVNVVDGTIPLKVSLCWTDYPGNPAVVKQLVNDLDLTVTNGAVTYLGNVFSTGVSVTGGARDSVNVEEGVDVAAPLAAGVWTIRITGTNIPIGPQAFGLVITGGVGTTAGALALDRALYGSASTVQLRVTDTNAGSSVNVSLASPTEPAGETVALTGSNGILTGSIPLSPYPGTNGDHVLQVSSGDVITATYQDVTPAATLVATAQVDFYPPAITAVRANNQGAGSVLVQWNTNSNASSRVYYGATPALGGSTTLDPLARLSHQVSVTGLAMGQTYYYDVESQDLNGNITRDDNGGLHYRFTVNPIADLLLVYDGSGFERSGSYTSALTALGWTFDVWTGPQSQSPVLGDLSSGLRAYRAVWWQNGLENYPPFSDAARDALTQYMDGGGRLSVVGHDLGWANQDNTSPYYTPARAAWVQGTLHTQFVADPAGWTSLTGVGGDPISGAYTAGVPYAEHRPGASGDQVTSVAGSGTAFYDWLDPVSANCGIRWESSGPLGTPGAGVWGGSVSRLAAQYFEWSSIDTTSPNSAIRSQILSNTLLWLIGRAKPAVTVMGPNGGEVITGNSFSINWTESTAGGTSVGSRRIEYSLDGGQSWTLISASPGAPPYSWDVSAVPNSPSALVRVQVADDGSPSLSTSDVSDAVFTLNRAGGDVLGPVVTAGSIHCTPTPVDNQQPAALVATVTDAGSGNSNIDAAEWSFGEAPAAPGTGQPMSGSFTAPTATVSATLTTGSFSTGTHTLWVRAHDAAGNWGRPLGLSILVNGTQPLAVNDARVDFGLAQNAPNPVLISTLIRYSLPVRGDVDLSVFDVGGRRVRSLVSGSVAAGIHSAGWDRRDQNGRLVQPGVYYYRLAVAGRTFERRLVTLN